jgi:hypothetical protein
MIARFVIQTALLGRNPAFTLSGRFKTVDSG